MNEPTRVARRYDENEISAILKRATELQQEEPSRALAAGGLTLGELEEIAAEAGIDPQFLRRAASEIDFPAPTASAWSGLVGDDVTLIRTAVVPGELADRDFERLVFAIQSETGEHGQPSVLGRTLTWRGESGTSMRKIQVTVHSRDDETHIRVEERLHELASGLHGGVVAGAGLGVGLGVGLPIGLNVLGSVLFSTAFPIGFVGLSYLAARSIYRRIARRRRAAQSALLERLVQEVSDAVRSTPLDEQP